MADVKLVYNPIQAQVGYIDIALFGRDLDGRDSLSTAVLMSLFTDRKASRDDPLPNNISSRRGWWGDTFADVENDLIGSRLWLLSREKQLDSTLSRAREYVNESVLWMVEDGLASKVDTDVFWIKKAEKGSMGIIVTATRPDGNQETFRYDYLWQELVAIPILTKADEDSLIPIETLLTETGEAIITENSEGLS